MILLRNLKYTFFVAFIMLLALAIVASFAAAPPARIASAAVDCSILKPNGIRVEIIDLDNSNTFGNRINHLGAAVKFSPNPLTGGIGSLTVTDNGSFDDSDFVGRIELEETCSGAYELTLIDAACDIADATLSANTTEGDAVVSFKVDDCKTATATPTATATTVPTATATAVPTSTPTPAATATVAPTSTPNVVFVPVPVIITPEPTAVPVTTVKIVPPSTGDAGLR